MIPEGLIFNKEPPIGIFKINKKKYLINYNTVKVNTKKLFVLGIVLFFCLFLVGCNWIITPTIISDNGGMDEYDPQVIALLDKLNTPLKLLNGNNWGYIPFS